MSGGIKQTDFLNELSTELLITLKYNLNKEEYLNKISSIEKEVVLDIYSKFNNIPIESKFQFGQLIMELIMSEFDYMFIKHNIVEFKENHIFLNIKRNIIE